MRIQRDIEKQIRKGLSWKQLWEGEDKGLVACWENGRKHAKENPEIKARAFRGELPVLNWKGGIEVPLKIGMKYGTLNYLACWQGLRGDDLDIDLEEEVELICSRTEMLVVFTPHDYKYVDLDYKWEQFEYVIELEPKGKEKEAFNVITDAQELKSTLVKLLPDGNFKATCKGVSASGETPKAATKRLFKEIMEPKQKFLF